MKKSLLIAIAMFSLRCTLHKEELALAPEPSFEGKNRMAFLIDGRQVYADGGSSGRMFGCPTGVGFTCDYFEVTIAGQYYDPIDAKIWEGVVLMFTVFEGPIDELIGYHQVRNEAHAQYFCQCGDPDGSMMGLIDYYAPDSSGYLNITHANEKFKAGTFAFTSVSEYNDTIVVSDGWFDISTANN